MTNLDSMWKNRDITLPIKAMVYSRLWFFQWSYMGMSIGLWRKLSPEELMLLKFEDSWCWRRLLRVHWTARRSNQSILKEISPGCSLEGLMLKLKLCLATSCEELTHWKRPWCWEGLGAGGEGDDRGWDGWMASPTWWAWVWVNSRGWWWTGRPGVLWFIGSQIVGRAWATELNETEVFFSVIYMHTGMFLLWLSWIGLYTSWSWVTIFFFMLGKFLTMITSNIFSRHLSFSSSWISIIWILVCYNVPQRCLGVSSFLSIPFFFFFFYSFCSIDFHDSVFQVTYLFYLSYSVIIYF